jgi:hypothetical protein
VIIKYHLVVSCWVNAREITWIATRIEIYALKLTWRRVQRYIIINIQICTPRGLIITNQSFCHKEVVQSFETAEFKLAESGNTTGGHPWCLQLSSSTHSSSQPGGISPGHTSPKALPGSTYYSNAEYTNTQQDLLDGDNYFTNSRHERLFWLLGFFLLKSNKEHVLTFKILAQVLVVLIFTMLANYYRQSCTIQLTKHSIHQLPSLGISWLVE